MLFFKLKTLTKWLILVQLVCISSHLSANTYDKENDFLEALKFSDAKIWDKAILHAKKIDSPVGLKLIDWLRLRASDGEFHEFHEFLNLNPDWPGLALLKSKGEYKLSKDISTTDTIKYFENTFPSSGKGSLMLANSLSIIGEIDAAKKIALVAWLSQTFSDEDFTEMINRYGPILQKSNSIRLDNMLWLRSKTSVNQMLYLVSKTEQTMAEVRLALQNGVENPSIYISRLSKKQIEDPGLVFDRLNYRRQRGLYDSVEKLLVSRSTAYQQIGKPLDWARVRQIYARRALRYGRIKSAYTMASSHFLNFENSFSDPNKFLKAYVDLEWLSGFIAFEFLGKPKLAKKHFEESLKKSKGSSSISKGNYWLGRVYEKLGDQKKAIEVYKLAVTYQETFYGQLSAERINYEPDKISEYVRIKKRCEPNLFDNNEIFGTGILLLNSERSVLAARFFKHLGETLTMKKKWCLAMILDELGLKLASIRIAKTSIDRDKAFYKFAFPIFQSANPEYRYNTSLLLSIVRQESEFYSTAVSSTGALGLMQVMPRTAKELVKKLGLKYDRKRMLRDQDYNIKIGAYYITKLLDRFDGSMILATAAYNAGPTRVNSWINQFGDPRKKGVDPLVWIEMIPFMETKNYVIKVLASEKTYSAILSDSDLSLDLGRENFGHQF